MNCPECGDKLRSVSALTHGCVHCQRLLLMINGKLQDGGEWPVAEEQEHIRFGRGCLFACIVSILIYAALIWVTYTFGFDVVKDVAMFILGCALSVFGFWLIYQMILEKDRRKGRR